MLPVESAVVDLLELPGLGFAVATYHQLHFFGDSATYGASAQEVETIEALGGVSLIKALSQRRFLVAPRAESEVAIYSWSFNKVRRRNLDRTNKYSLHIIIYIYVYNII